MRESIVFYRSFHEAIRELPQRYRNELYPALIGYGLTGEEPEGLSLVSQSVFILCRAVMDSTAKRYDDACKSRGGAPKGNTNARKQPKTTEKQPAAKTKRPKTTEKQLAAEKKQPNDNVNYNEDDNVNKNVSVCSSRAKNGAASAATQRHSFFESNYLSDMTDSSECRSERTDGHDVSCEADRAAEYNVSCEADRADGFDRFYEKDRNSGAAADTSPSNTGTGGSGVSWLCGCSTDNIDCTSKCNVSNETGRCSESASDTSQSNTGTGGGAAGRPRDYSTDSADRPRRIGRTAGHSIYYETGHDSGPEADASLSNAEAGGGAVGRPRDYSTDSADRMSRTGRMYSRDRTSCAGHTVRRQVRMIWLPAILSRRRCRPERTVAVPLSRRRSRCGIYAEGVP